MGASKRWCYAEVECRRLSISIWVHHQQSAELRKSPEGYLELLGAWAESQGRIGIENHESRKKRHSEETLNGNRRETFRRGFLGRREGVGGRRPAGNWDETTAVAPWRTGGRFDPRAGGSRSRLDGNTLLLLVGLSSGSRGPGMFAYFRLKAVLVLFRQKFLGSV
jgi:hypothetical protein